jgi:predicted PurR-regulated permease PerM
MKALTWPHVQIHLHMPHRHHEARVVTIQHHHVRNIMLGTITAYVALAAILLITASTVWSMNGAEAWGFAMGVASYILLFSAFIAGLAWVCVKNLADDPSRR